MEIKKNAPLWIGIGLPILTILVVAATIYFPSLTAKKPQFDFLYSVQPELRGNFGPPEGYYEVENGKLVVRKYSESVPGEKPIPSTDNSITSAPLPKLYRYDVETNTNQELTLEQAQELNLDRARKSPDGFEVVNSGYGYEMMPFFFGGGPTEPKRYLKKGTYSQEIATEENRDYYGSFYGFNMLGWIK